MGFWLGFDGGFSMGSTVMGWISDGGFTVIGFTRPSNGNGGLMVV